MLTIIFTWIVLFFSISLIGGLLIKKVDWYEYFWVGLVAVFGLLQVWSLFLPVNVYSLIFVIGTGLALAVIYRKNFKLPKIKFKTLFYIGLILLGVSYFASLPVGWEDTYLYHLNFVKWSNLYAVVPGLANLHDRFGFNSSLFLFASMIDNWIMRDRSSHVALSLMASVLTLEFLWIFIKSKSRILKLFCLFAFPLLAVNIVKRTMVASLSPDFALTMIIFAICIEFLKDTKKSLIVAGLLSILLVTIKLSGVSFAVLILLFVLYKFWKRENKEFKKLFLVLFVSGLALFVPFVVRNIYLSGWPLYPLPAFGFSVPWALSKDSTTGMYNVIQAWARQPGEEWSKYVSLPFWQWFPHWYTNNVGWLQIHMFIWGIILALVAPLAGIVDKIKIRQMSNLLIIGFISLISVCYTILTAPDLRFGEAYFWLFFAVVVAYYAKVLIDKSQNNKILVILVGVYLVFTFSWPVRIDSEPIWKSVRWEPSFSAEKVVVNPSDGSPPFTVYEPTENSLCGNSDLPCTPKSAVFDGKVKEIVPGDMSKGFEPIR